MEVDGKYSEEILRKTLEWLKEAESFAVDQVPLLVEEVLWFETVTHGLGTLLFLFLVPSLFFFGYKMFSWGREASYSTEGRYYIGGSVSYLLAGFSAFGLFHNTYTFIKIQVAPRLFLIEYFSDMVG